MEVALFLWWRPGGMSSVFVVEAWWNQLCFCDRGEWKKLCFCRGGLVESALFLWWRPG
jgi:hypothetical protein